MLLSRKGRDSSPALVRWFHDITREPSFCLSCHHSLRSSSLMAAEAPAITCKMWTKGRRTKETPPGQSAPFKQPSCKSLQRLYHRPNLRKGKLESVSYSGLQNAQLKISLLSLRVKGRVKAEIGTWGPFI